MSEFEKHRDLLIQEISSSINSIVLNLNTLNRSLHNSVQVSKEFNNVSELWANFYQGLKQEQEEEHGGVETGDEESEEHEEGERAD